MFSLTLELIPGILIGIAGKPIVLKPCVYTSTLLQLRYASAVTDHCIAVAASAVLATFSQLVTDLPVAVHQTLVGFGHRKIKIITFASLITGL